MNELSIIKSKIYEIRGVNVMLDFDLAAAYGIDTAQLKRQVRRNIERFEGEDFMFQLTKEEFEILKCQFGMSSWGGTRYLPFAFPELGVAMLSSVLNSMNAIEMNRNIMRAFVVIRQYALGYAELNRKLEDFMAETNMQFNDVYQALKELAKRKSLSEEPMDEVGYTAKRYFE